VAEEMAAVSFPCVLKRQPSKKAQWLAQAAALWRHWKAAWAFVSEPLFQESHSQAAMAPLVRLPV